MGSTSRSLVVAVFLFLLLLLVCAADDDAPGGAPHGSGASRDRRMKEGAVKEGAVPLRRRDGDVGGGRKSDHGEDQTGWCAPGCKPAYLGDGSCDDECFNEPCGWDGDDCDANWELKRTLVFSPRDGYKTPNGVAVGQPRIRTRGPR